MKPLIYYVRGEGVHLALAKKEYLYYILVLLSMFLT